MIVNNFINRFSKGIAFNDFIVNDAFGERMHPCNALITLLHNNILKLGYSVICINDCDGKPPFSSEW